MVDDDQDPQTALVVESETETTYLNDPQNPTGYSQVIEEITRDSATQDITKDLVFTLGHDVIAQTEIDPAQAGTEAGDPLFLLYDGHGSTRFLAALDAAIQEGYSYDAYGNPIGFDPATALTALLYSGDPFDTRINQQYLRARWYDLSTGRFNRVDPFFGNLRDPQSLHKYLFAHGDPINGNDPTGMFTAASSMVSSSIAVTLGAMNAMAMVGARVAAGASIGFMFGMHIGTYLGFLDGWMETGDLNVAFDRMESARFWGGLFGAAEGAMNAVMPCSFQIVWNIGWGIFGAGQEAEAAYDAWVNDDPLLAMWKAGLGFSSLFGALLMARGCFVADAEVMIFIPLQAVDAVSQTSKESVPVTGIDFLFGGVVISITGWALIRRFEGRKRRTDSRVLVLTLQNA